MPYVSPFSTRRRTIVPTISNPQPMVRLDHRGLDLTSPYDVVKDNRSPFAKNFRMYAEESDDRRVSISSRKGPGFYTTPLTETVDQQNTGVTGAADQNVGVTTSWKAMPFTAGATGPLTKVELRLKNNSLSRGPVVVEIYTNVANAPGVKIADSGILSTSVTGSYAYLTARFVEAPTVTATVTYWIVSYVQDDGSGTYSWSSNTSTTLAKTSDSTGQSWTATAYSLNFKTYVSSAALIKGATRYAPTNSQNKTLLPIGTAMYVVDDTDGSIDSIATGLSSSATRYHFTYADDKVFWVNGFDSLRSWDGTTVEAITHAQLPILSIALFHKDRLYGVGADDPNRIVFSELPGNDDGAGNEWYKAYLSTSFRYVPVPKASDPITAMLSFQDNLIIFTKNFKWVLFGSSPGDFYLRQAMGSKGAVSQSGVCADANYVYFVGDNRFYRYNGAQDEIISDMIQPEIGNVTNPANIFVTDWKGRIRFYYAASGSPVNNKCLIWHTVFEEWEMDTDAFVSFAVPFTDSNDDYELLEVSSTAPTAYFAEIENHSIGKQIDFEYRCKYDSLGLPAVRKRVKKLFPLIEGDGGDYPISIGVDKDLLEAPRFTNVDVSVGGTQLGTFDMDDGIMLGQLTRFSVDRVQVSGYFYYSQVIIKRKAINNPVRFIGYMLSIKAKRL